MFEIVLELVFGEIGEELGFCAYVDLTDAVYQFAFAHTQKSFHTVRPPVSQRNIDRRGFFSLAAHLAGKQSPITETTIYEIRMCPDHHIWARRRMTIGTDCLCPIKSDRRPTRRRGKKKCVSIIILDTLLAAENLTVVAFGRAGLSSTSGEWEYCLCGLVCAMDDRHHRGGG